MNNGPKGFDAVASSYDGLARLIFGRSIVDAQLLFLSEIPDKATVLILGGGTGWLLQALQSLRPNNSVWYVDASAKMILKARKKSPLPHNVHFIHGTEADLPPGVLFDSVITNFYFDLFRQETLPGVIEKIKKVLKPEAVWLTTDFVNKGYWWQRVLLNVMYTFFNALTDMEANALPNWQESMRVSDLKLTQSRLFFSGFIESGVYRPYYFQRDVNEST